MTDVILAASSTAYTQLTHDPPPPTVGDDMGVYVYALHDFYPENEDEVSFRAGERIEVIEKDDHYGDGWWQGRNIAGQVGLFPQSYTSTSPSSIESPVDPAISPFLPPNVPVSGSHLHPLPEESESQAHTRDASSPSPLNINGYSSAKNSTSNINGSNVVDRQPGDDSAPADGEAMQVTLTDVQKALEQLGRSNNDLDGNRSFSFASGQDTENETETDTDFEVEDDKTEDWHKGARRKLAEKARRAVEEAEKLEMLMNGYGPRSVAPPIEFELSDESEGDDDERPRHVRKYEMGRQHPHIPEEDEEAEEDASNPAVNQELPPSGVQKSHDSADVIAVPIHDPTDLPTATGAQSTFPVSPMWISPAASQDQQPTIVGAAVDTTPLSFPKPTATRPPDSMTQQRTAPSAIQFPTQANPQSSGPAQSRISSGLVSTPTSTLVGQQDTSTSDGEKKSDQKRHPSDWSVEEVVEWLNSKGFGQDVCEKFIEQEITGDVLLELDATLLKTEIGVMAFGKRVRISNAIAELRRPPSVNYSDHHVSPVLPNPHSPTAPSPGHSRSESQAPSQSYSYASARQSLQGPMNFGPPVYAILSPESPPNTGDISGSPARISFSASQSTNVNLTAREPDKQIVSEVSTSDERGVVGLGISSSGPPNFADRLLKTRPATLTLSPSDPALRVTAQAISGALEDGEDDRGVMSEGEAPQPATAVSMRRRLFGRSHDSAESGKSKDRRISDPSKLKRDNSAKASPTKDADPDAASSVTSRHSKGKKSTDNGKPSDRLSLFGTAFPAQLGKSRKPPPKYQASETHESQTEKSPNSISRLYNQKKASIRSRNSAGSTADSKQALSPTARGFRSDFDKEASVLRKRLTPISPSRASIAVGEPFDMEPILDQFEPGRSILEQVGDPDFSGWMRKKGDRYNSWKMRFFILKGPHLYCLKSNSKAETKIKGYVNIQGYKVVADENADPGRYAFKIIHESDKTHFFSSSDQQVIRDWMKAIMKATIGRDYTQPVISSCNVPTIPLVVAQTMNPAPRPPSPSARDATQKALRRENPNQLSSRDARVLMGLPSPPTELRDYERLRLESFFVGEPVSNFNGSDQPPVLPPLSLSAPTSPEPSRPIREREARGVASRDELTLTAADRSLIEWANSHLPSSLRISEARDPLCGGLTLLRLAESIRGRPSSPPVPDSAFPSGPNDDKLDGLFKLFDFLLDNDVKMGVVSINDVRHGKRDKILQLLRALKVWEDKRRVVAQSVGKGAMAS